MNARILAHRARLPAVLAVIALLTACAFPYVPITLSSEPVALTQGSSAVVTAYTGTPRCSPGADALPCADVTGALFDFDITGAPDGLTTAIDTSLQSRATPGLVRITITASPSLPPNNYQLAIHATLDGVTVGTSRLSVHVMAGGAQPSIGDVIDVAAGTESSFALLLDGTALSFGGNGEGELGSGDRVHRALPGPVERLTGVGLVTSNLADAVEARSGAVGTDGTVSLWGSNDDGYLLRSVPADLLAPEPAGALAALDIIDVAIGARHVLALDSDGTVYTWGDNELGQIGGEGPAPRLSPAPIQGLPPIRAVAVGLRFSMALARDGSIWGWGENEGRLGRGESVPSLFDGTPAPVSGIGDAVAIAAGRQFTLALLADGSVVAWGRNGSSQLGDGTTTDRSAPVPVDGIGGITAIAAGGSHGLALGADGTVWGWGANGSGQILVQNGSDRARQSVPAPVPGLSDITAIAGGGQHSIALNGCGQLWTFGRNEFGQRGEGYFSIFKDGSAHLVAGTGRPGECEVIPLRVAIAGPGSLSSEVTSPDITLRCLDRECLSYQVVPLPRTAPITLIARARDNAVFAGWSGDCQGTERSITVSFDRPASCVAVFDADEPVPVLLSVSGVGGHIASSGAQADDVLGPSAIDCGPTCGAVYDRDSVVTLTASPDPGFELVRWLGDCAGTAPVIDVLMDATRRCDARFRPFDLSVQIDGGGRVTSVPAGIDCPGTCAFPPREGAVTLAATPAPGWFLSGWTGDCGGFLGEVQVTMDADRACGATFLRDPSQRFLEVQVFGPAGSVQSTPAGIDACTPGSTCRALFPTGSTVDLLASPGSGNEVVGWDVDCAAAGGNVNSVVMDTDLLCVLRIADIDDPEFPVATFGFSPTFPRVGDVVRFDAAGSYVFDPDTGQRDGSAIRTLEWDFGFDGIVDVAGNRAEAAVVERAFQSPGTFTVQLRVTGGDNGPGGSPGQAFERRDITVQPEQGQVHGLTVTKAGTGSGTIRSVPAGLVACGDACQSSGPRFIAEDEVVTLEAVAAAGSAFAGWSGDCTGQTSQVDVTMSAARTCTASFNRTVATLGVTVTGIGSVSGPGIDCGGDCIETLALASVAELTAEPGAGYRLESWSGCDSVSGNTCSVTLNADRNVTATFAAERFQLLLINSGGGRVTGTPGIDCGADCTETVDSGTAIALVATPDPGFQFTGWGFACAGLPATTQVVMTADLVCRANFAPIPTGFTLTVELVLFGNAAPGRIVATSPPGSVIDCGTVCTDTIPPNTVVQLRSEPVPGAAFGGFLSGCDTFVNNQCQFVMTGDRTVRAGFEPGG